MRQLAGCSGSCVAPASADVGIIAASASGLFSSCTIPDAPMLNSGFIGSGSTGRRSETKGDPMAHLQIVRILDVVVEHLCEEQERLVRSDRKAESGGHPGRQHSL